MNAMGYRISPNGWEVIPEDGVIIKLDFIHCIDGVAEQQKNRESRHGSIMIG